MLNDVIVKTLCLSVPVESFFYLILISVIVIQLETMLYVKKKTMQVIHI